MIGEIIGQTKLSARRCVIGCLTRNLNQHPSVSQSPLSDAMPPDPTRDPAAGQN